MQVLSGRVLSGLMVAALIAGCATPREACINSATRDVRRAQSRVAELERDLARGYIEVEEDVTRRRWGWCDVGGRDGGGKDRPSKGRRGDSDKHSSGAQRPPTPPRRVQERCVIEEDYTITRRERVNRPASERELTVLRRQISQATRPMEAAVAQCRIDFPAE
jgi:hypothetical protein